MDSSNFEVTAMRTPDPQQQKERKSFTRMDSTGRSAQHIDAGKD